jgi:enterobacteria phage integrase
VADRVRGTTGVRALLFTGQRMSDVSRMAWSDVRDGAIRVVQGKTGAKLAVPLHPELAEVLAAWPRSHQRILTMAFGKPFTPKGFGDWMVDKIGQSGVASRRITHGLRKAAARRLAEAGCSANEIAAITGHATPEKSNEINVSLFNCARVQDVVCSA